MNMNMNMTTTSNITQLNSARDKLRFWAIRDATVVLDILKAHPSLAQETFFCGCVCNGKKGQSLSPLASLIALQAPLDILQQVLDLYPDAALGKCSNNANGSDPCLPLHVAAATHTSCETVAFLAQQFPQTVSMPDASGNLPLHHALHSPFEQASLETIQCLVDIYPQAILQPNKNRETPLQYAIENSYEDAVLDHLASHLPKLALASHNNNNNARSFTFANCLTLNLERCHAMTRLLPYITSLTCRPSQWTWEGLEYLLTYMANNNNDNNASRVQTLVLEWIPRAFFTSNHRLGQLLRELLRNSSGSTLPLRDLRLQIKNAWFDKNRNSDIQCLETIGTILQSAIRLPQDFSFSLKLHSFQLYKDTLEQFLRTAQPQQLSLNCCTIFENSAMVASRSATATKSTTTTTTLQRLELVQTRMSNTIFRALLNTVVQQMPRLQHLKLIFRRTEDFGDVRGLLDLTDFLTQMLPRLETVTLEGLYVSPKLLEPLAQPKLQQSTSTSLSTAPSIINTHCYVEYIQYGTLCRNLQYYTALKYFGKSLLLLGGVDHNDNDTNDNNSDATSLIRVLQALEDFDDIKEATIKDQIRYGLLIEWCPSLLLRGC